MKENYIGKNPKTYSRINKISGHHFALFIAENLLCDADIIPLRIEYANNHIKTLNKVDLRNFVAGWVKYLIRKKKRVGKEKKSIYDKEIDYIKKHHTTDKEIFISFQYEKLFYKLLKKVNKTDVGLSILYHSFKSNHKIIATKDEYILYCLINEIVPNVGSIRTEDEATSKEENYFLYKKLKKQVCILDK